MSTYPFEVGPSQRFRIGQYIPYLEKKGHRLDYHSFYRTEDYHELFKQGGQMMKAVRLIKGYLRLVGILARAKKYDAIFIQRETSPVGPPLVAIYLKHVLNKRLIYDFDDAIWLPNYTEENKYFHWMKAYWKVRYLIKMSNITIAGNEYLASYAKKHSKDVLVIPTVVDTSNSHKPSAEAKENSRLTIGWTGSISTIPHLKSVESVLRKLQGEFHFRLLVISNSEPLLEGVEYDFEQWSKEQEVDRLREMDIGIMPLPDTDWTKGKCGFKAIQYMSVGVPTVASGVGMNQELIQHMVNGALCDSEDAWYTVLKALLEDPVLRMKLGEQGRRTAVVRYSVSSQLDRLEQTIKGHLAV